MAAGGRSIFGIPVRMQYEKRENFRVLWEKTVFTEQELQAFTSCFYDTVTAQIRKHIQPFVKTERG